jgi:hypothetical protein
MAPPFKDWPHLAKYYVFTNLCLWQILAKKKWRKLRYGE